MSWHAKNATLVNGYSLHLLVRFDPLWPQRGDSASQGANKILLGLTAQAGLGLIIRNKLMKKLKLVTELLISIAAVLAAVAKIISLLP